MKNLQVRAKTADELKAEMLDRVRGCVRAGGKGGLAAVGDAKHYGASFAECLQAIREGREARFDDLEATFCGLG